MGQNIKFILHADINTESQVFTCILVLYAREFSRIGLVVHATEFSSICKRV